MENNKELVNNISDNIKNKEKNRKKKKSKGLDKNTIEARKIAKRRRNKMRKQRIAQKKLSETLQAYCVVHNVETKFMNTENHTPLTKLNQFKLNSNLNITAKSEIVHLNNKPPLTKISAHTLTEIQNVQTKISMSEPVEKCQDAQLNKTINSEKVTDKRKREEKGSKSIEGTTKKYNNIHATIINDKVYEVNNTIESVHSWNKSSEYFNSYMKNNQAIHIDTLKYKEVTLRPDTLANSSSNQFTQTYSQVLQKNDIKKNGIVQNITIKKENYVIDDGTFKYMEKVQKESRDENHILNKTYSLVLSENDIKKNENAQNITIKKEPSDTDDGKENPRDNVQSESRNDNNYLSTNGRSENNIDMVTKTANVESDAVKITKSDVVKDVIDIKSIIKDLTDDEDVLAFPKDINHLCICDFNFYKHQLLDQIETSILPLQFKGVTLEPFGWITIKCASKLTAEWILNKKISATADENEETQFVFNLRRNIPNLTRPMTVYMKFPYTFLGPVNIITMLERQNPGLDTKTWIFLRNRNGKLLDTPISCNTESEHIIYVKVDENSLKFFQKNSWKLFFKLGEIDVQLVDLQKWTSCRHEDYSKEISIDYFI